MFCIDEIISIVIILTLLTSNFNYQICCIVSIVKV